MVLNAFVRRESAAVPQLNQQRAASRTVLLALNEMYCGEQQQCRASSNTVVTGEEERSALQFKGLLFWLSALCISPGRSTDILL